jgi:hypothetical protein
MSNSGIIHVRTEWSIADEAPPVPTHSPSPKEDSAGKFALCETDESSLIPALALTKLIKKSRHTFLLGQHVATNKPIKSLIVINIGAQRLLVASLCFLNIGVRLVYGPTKKKQRTFKLYTIIFNT